MAEDFGIPAIDEGQYFFVGYNSEDAKRVAHIAKQLHQRDIVMWYDKGIDYGEEWEIVITRKIKASKAVILFFTKGILEKRDPKSYVQKEFKIAKHFDKKIFMVFLDTIEKNMIPTDITSWWLDIDDLHNFYQHKYKKLDYFIDEMVEAFSKYKKNDTTEEDTPAEKQQITVGKIEKSKDENDSEQSFQNITNLVRKTIPKLWRLVCCASILLGLGVGIFIINQNTNVKIGDETFERSRTSIKLTNTQIGDSELQQINKLKDVSTLSFEDCSITADLSKLNNLASITNFTLTSCEVADYDFISKLENVYVLILENPSSPDELTDEQLATVPIQELTKVKIDGYNISNLNVFSNAPKLRYLHITNCAVESINSLASLETLKYLAFDGCPIDSVTETFRSLRIESISFRGCGLTDLSGLNDLTILKAAYLGDNQLSSIPDCLKKSAETLTSLSLRNNPISGEDVETLIPGCGKIEYLDVSGISLNDLALVEKSKQLISIDASSCGLTDMKGLETEHPELGVIILSNNQISSIGDILTRTTKNGYLFLDNNKINDCSSLPLKSEESYWYYVFLNGNSINMDTLPVNLNIYKLFLDYNKDLLTFDFDQENITYMYLLNTPRDQMLKLEDKIIGVNFYTEEDIQACKDEIMSSLVRKDNYF